MNDPSGIALEHVLWCADQGMSPRDVLLSIGERWEWGFDPTTSYVVRRVEFAWQRISVPVKPVLRVVA